MDVILIPGLWLDGSSWDRVVPTLERAGHRPVALTLPGMQSASVDRSAIGLHDHVAAVLAAIDAAAGPVVLVGHSAGAATAYAAVDARPDRVARAIYVGGFPTGDGDPPADGYPAVDGGIPLPDWSAFDEADLVDLDDALRAEFRQRAVPSPEGVGRGPQRLADERRYAVPTTVICPEFTSEALRGWLAAGAAPVRELARIRHVDYVDLPTGHWPQFTRPQELGAAIVAAIETTAAEGARYDDHGRPEPPAAAGEIATVVGFLDYQRATLEWKCAGLDAAGLRATTAASSMTLGGLLKHMALVEDGWFPRAIGGQQRRPPWDAVDWDADPDWEWRTAAEDSPEELFALWRDAVDRSRSVLAAALAAGGLDQPSRRTFPDGMTPSVRWILLHMIEEYARHNGHADLLRESVDGATGE